MSDALVEQALALPYEERVSLASRLLDSLTEEELTDAARNNEALLAELRRRDDEMSNGTDPCRPFGEALADARRAIGCD